MFWKTLPKKPALGLLCAFSITALAAFAAADDTAEGEEKPTVRKIERAPEEPVKEGEPPKDAPEEPKPAESEEAAKEGEPKAEAKKDEVKKDEGEKEDAESEEAKKEEAVAAKPKTRTRAQQKAFERSQKQMRSLEPAFRKKVARVLVALEAKGWEPVVISGRRDIKQQRKIVAAGRSRTMKSYHLCGRAADIMDRRHGWRGAAANPNFQFWVDLGIAARAEGLVWGGDWRKIKDVPHIQTKKRCGK